MTTTDDSAERLARLQARRSATTEPTEQQSPTPGPNITTGPSRRRRSPALSAKVLTVGVSTTAMLGMMAGYGIAEGRADQAPTLEPVTDPPGPSDATPVAAVPTTLATPTPPTPTAPTQVIVVVVDGRTGEPIDTGALAQAAIDGELGGEVGGGLTADTTVAATSASPEPAASEPIAPPTPVPAPETPTAPAPAPAPKPVAVDVPTPVPAPAPAAAPAPAPRPEASSGGS